MYLNHISYYLPGSDHQLSDLVALGEINETESCVFERMMGLKRIARDNASTVYSLGTMALQQFFNETNCNPEKIKYFLFAHTGEYVAPFEFQVMKKWVSKFKISNAYYFGSSINKCASAFHLLQLAQSLCLSLNDNDKILLLIADNTFTPILKTIPGSTILGDCATAVQFNKIPDKNRLIDVCLEVDGRFASGNYAGSDEKLLFQSVYIKKVSEIILKILRKNNILISQIKYIFPHNVNTLSWNQVAQELNIPVSKIYFNNICRTGHCFGSDPFVNLKDALLSDLLQTGDFYLLVSVGLGATFSVMLFQH